MDHNGGSSVLADLAEALIKEGVLSEPDQYYLRQFVKLTPEEGVREIAKLLASIIKAGP